MAIFPVPAGRSSDSLMTQRLLTQLQNEQKRLLQVSQQLGTGLRIQLASEDPPAAGRAMSLQRLLEANSQLATNLATSQSYLDATDTTLNGVADLLINARGLAVLAADGTTTQLEREAIAIEIEATIDELMVAANQSFRGRYLFAGTDSTVRPFESHDDYVQYVGNDLTFRSLATRDLLVDTNVPGQDLFGAVSGEVRGLDLNANLRAETRLSDLRGGQGITEGSIIISDGMSSSTVMLSDAQTIGDVARLIEENPPDGRQVRAVIGASGLTIEMADNLGGSLLVRDLQGGITAAELGIVRLNGSAADPIVGQDLNPILRLTTRLDEILGVRARAYVRSAGPNNDVLVEARDRGIAGNGFQVQYVDDDFLQSAPGLTAGGEYAEFDTAARAARGALRLSGIDNDLILTADNPGVQWNNVQIEIDASQNLGNAANVSFDPGANRLLIEIDDTDQTTLGTMVAAINGSGIFTASPDPSLGDGYNPAGSVLSLDAGVRGNTGNSGGEANTMYVYIDAGNTTANQVVDALRGNAQIDAQFDIQLASDDSQTAALAGSRAVDVTASGVTAGGAGNEWDQTSGFQVINAGETHVVNIGSAETIEDVLNILNAADTGLLAEINVNQDGINVRSRRSGTDMYIGENGGTTATDLGLRTIARDTRLSELNYGQGVNAATGTDFVIHRNDGVELEIDISTATTIGDVIDLINSHPNNLDPTTAVVAQLTAFGNGIELVNDNPAAGDTLSVRRDLFSNVAWELGLVPWGEDQSLPAQSQSATATVTLAAPNDVNTAFQVTSVVAGTAMNGIDIELRSTLVGDVATATFDPIGRRLVIDMADGQTTANTVLAAINGEGTFTAALDLTTDPTNDGSGTLVAPAGVAATTAGGTEEVFVSDDANPIETEGLFNSLLRLRDAIVNHDVEGMPRIVEMFDADFDRLNFGRAAVGAHNQGLDTISIRNEDDGLVLSKALSEEIDVDLAEAASDFASRQAALEASLRTIANMYRLSLLDFL